MRVQIKNKHCFKWLEAYITRLQVIHDKAIEVSNRTDANIRVERIEAHFNKLRELYYIEYSNFESERKCTIKILISEFKLAKNKHNIY